MPPKKPAMESRREREEKEILLYDAMIGEEMEFDWTGIVYCGTETDGIRWAADYVDVYQGDVLVAEGEPVEDMGLGEDEPSGYRGPRNFVFLAPMKVRKTLRGFRTEPSGRTYALFGNGWVDCRIVYYVNTRVAYEEVTELSVPPYMRMPYGMLREKRLPPCRLGDSNPWGRKMEAIRGAVDRWGI